MKNYLLAIGLILLMSAVSGYHEYYAAHAPANSQASCNPAVTTSDCKSADNQSKYAQRNAQIWHVIYLIFGWPNGVGICGLFLTFVAIADQAVGTRKAAEASKIASQANLKQARIARRALILQFRPKLIVRGGAVNDDGTVTLWITNSGGSKAYIYHLMFNFHVLDSNNGYESDAADLANQIDSDITLTAGETILHTLKLTPQHQAIAKRHRLYALRSGEEGFTKSLVWAGSIMSRDNLKIERMTMIMRHFDPVRGKFEVKPNSDNDYAD